MSAPPRTELNLRPRVTRRRLMIAVGVALLTAAAVAIAAHPKKGAHFAGTSSEPVIMGFKAPVTFAVSSNGKTATNFRYSTLGCFGAGGFPPGVNPYTQANAVIKIGAVTISTSGRFARTGAVSVYHSTFGITTTTTTKLSGTFTGPKASHGKITFSQKDTGRYTGTCGPATISFTAKAP